MHLVGFIVRKTSEFDDIDINNRFYFFFTSLHNIFSE